MSYGSVDEGFNEATEELREPILYALDAGTTLMGGVGSEIIGCRRFGRLSRFVGEEKASAPSEARDGGQFYGSNGKEP